MAVDLKELQVRVEKELCEVSQDTLIKLAVFFKLEQGNTRQNQSLVLLDYYEDISKKSSPI